MESRNFARRIQSLDWLSYYRGLLSSSLLPERIQKTVQKLAQLSPSKNSSLKPKALIGEIANKVPLRSLCHLLVLMVAAVMAHHLTSSNAGRNQRLTLWPPQDMWGAYLSNQGFRENSGHSGLHKAWLQAQERYSDEITSLPQLWVHASGCFTVLSSSPYLNGLSQIYWRELCGKPEPSKYEVNKKWINLGSGQDAIEGLAQFLQTQPKPSATRKAKAIVIDPMELRY